MGCIDVSVEKREDFGVKHFLWRVCAILGNRYRIQGQNYVSLHQGSEMSTGFHYRNLILGT